MRYLWLVSLTLGCVIGGCYVGPVPRRDVVVVDQGHICGDGCSHYYRGGTWYVTEGHRHGPGCGHILRGGIWVEGP